MIGQHSDFLSAAEGGPVEDNADPIEASSAARAKPSLEPLMGSFFVCNLRATTCSTLENTPTSLL